MAGALHRRSARQLRLHKQPGGAHQAVEASEAAHGQLHATEHLQKRLWLILKVLPDSPQLASELESIKRSHSKVSKNDEKTIKKRSKMNEHR